MSDESKILPLDLGIAGALPRMPQIPRFIGQDSNGLAPKSVNAEIRKAATDFEAILLQQMVQSMWQTVPGDGALSGSKEESLYRDMLTQEISKTVASGQGIGIRGVVERELTRQAHKTGALGESDESSVGASNRNGYGSLKTKDGTRTYED